MTCIGKSKLGIADIAILGGVTAWAIFFPYFMLRAPFYLFSEVRSQLETSHEREQGAVTNAMTAQLQLKAASCRTIQ